MNRNSTILRVIGNSYWFVIFVVVSADVAGAPPKIERLFPAGAARSATAIVTASGEFPQWPGKWWANHAGITAVAEADKGKFKASVAADVPPGLYWVRSFDNSGSSSPKPFIVGTIPETEEVEPNNNPDGPQSIALPATINGRLAKSGDVDAFRIDLRTGQTLVASLDAHSQLGSPMDGVLQVCWLREETPGAAAGTLAPASDVSQSPRRAEAFVLEQSDDAVGIDPRIAMTVPKDGTYLVRLFAFPEEPNSTIGFAGGDNFVYRLTLTTGGFVDHAWPMTVTGDAPAEVELWGWNIPDPLRRVRVSAAPNEHAASGFHPELAYQARLIQVDHPTEVRAGNGTDQRISFPVSLTGRLEKAGERHSYLITGKKGTSLQVRVDSRSLGFETDPVVTVLDASGKEIAEDDDAREARDPELTWKIPADGQYQLVVRDLHGRGGLRFVYRMSVVEVAPDFSLTLAANSFVVAAGTSVEVPVKVARLNGFDEPIEITADRLPAGITAAAVTSPKGSDNAKLVLVADATAGEASGPIRIVGVSANAAAIRRTATYEITKPNFRRSDVWLTVTKGS